MIEALKSLRIIWEKNCIEIEDLPHVLVKGMDIGNVGLNILSLLQRLRHWEYNFLVETDKSCKRFKSFFKINYQFLVDPI